LVLWKLYNSSRLPISISSPIGPEKLKMLKKAFSARKSLKPNKCGYFGKSSK
jgi:hypothetical protein